MTQHMLVIGFGAYFTQSFWAHNPDLVGEKNLLPLHEKDQIIIGGYKSGHNFAHDMTDKLTCAKLCLD